MRAPDRLRTAADAGLAAGLTTAGSEALAATRRVVGLLRDTTPAPPGPPPGREHPGRLSELLERFQTHGPPAHLRLAAEPARWPPEVSSTVYRVVRESLTNISRHAPGARVVTVDITQDDHAVTVEIRNDAPQPPARRHHRPGYGLIGMRERLEALGGTLTAGPHPATGWSVRATIPTTGRTAPRTPTASGGEHR
ncbi:hypothetical protein Misp01_20360 [Microtetraspora sp. NBRC 13810]|uniref:sensor histidine kinase n=1 Tax=Microtetraspora sp. NBRC 13810 TaxID=3030990 RepID=UPI0024A5A5D4|nr:ATP-binding protein [Microtetraspora sp. NBRC 13810]GLW06906.1 hypothetical protein Misp01_20360 [Microtetraspora sp. NBRC 13810]